MKPTVFILSTYPFDTPRHGGQIRLAHIKKAYELGGCFVHALSCYEEEAYVVSNESQATKGNEFLSQSIAIAMPDHQAYRFFKGRYVPFANDLLSGEYAANEAFCEVLAALPARVDLIHVEQPWMWPVAKKIQALPRYQDVILVYGSQNIEATLKRDILSNFGVLDQEFLTAVHDLEKLAAQEADLCLAVTQEDASILRQFGAKSIILAPNAVEAKVVDQVNLASWRERLPSAPWILYVASDHPPNVIGFKKFLGDALGFIPPPATLVIAGAVSKSIESYLLQGKWAAFNRSRIQILGVLPEADLDAVKALAHAYILPIEQRSGSNLKTAEALYSDAIVVGTSAAFRGYETFQGLPGVFQGDTPQAFRQMLGKAIQQFMVNRECSQRSAVRPLLTWEHALSQLVSSIRKVQKG